MSIREEDRGDMHDTIIETISVSGGEVQVSHAGLKSPSLAAKPPVAYIRGFLGADEGASPVYPLTCASGRAALCINLHPNAHSKKPVPPEFRGGVTQWKQAAVVLEVLDALRIPRVSVVGHSAGAVIGTYAAGQEPERFSDLVLVNPAGFIPGERSLRLGMGFVCSLVQRLFHEMRNERSELSKAMVQGSKRQTLSHLRQGPRSISRLVTDLARADIRGLIAELVKSMPVHVLVGDRDVVFPALRVGFAARKAGATVTTMRGKLHDMFILNPEETMGKALELLDANYNGVTGRD